jgi:hypothetical protein
MERFRILLRLLAMEVSVIDDIHGKPERNGLVALKSIFAIC